MATASVLIVEDDDQLRRILTLKAMYGMLPLRDSRRTKGGQLPGSASATTSAPGVAELPRRSSLAA